MRASLLVLTLAAAACYNPGITLFGVEPEGADLGYFKIPSLRHLTVSIGQ